MAEVALRSGAVVDERYALKRLLGAGGCGAVWLASDKHTGDRDVVLKILHSHFDRFSIAVKQLAREAELLAQLEHPNIAKPFAFNSAGAHSYLAMEFIDGKTLDQEIGIHTRSDQYFEMNELVRLFTELCTAIIYAHSKTIIHRDLKPQNVMIIRRNGEVFVKVLDFGIAKLLEGNAFDATTFGRRLGSMFYMSPEQCKGEPADERSDIFSLGGILFEMLTLRRAWAWDSSGRPLRAFDAPVPADGANSLSSVLVRVATAPRPRPSDSRAKLPTKLDEIVVKALSIEPQRRFPTVQVFLDEFRRAAGAPELPRGSKEFLTEIVTVRSTAPAINKALYQDAGDTKLDPPEQPGGVWRIGGIQYKDEVATAMMKEVIDEEELDQTVPKLGSKVGLLSAPMDPDSGVTIGVANPDTRLFEAPLPRPRAANQTTPEVSVTARAEVSDPGVTTHGALAPVTDQNATAVLKAALDPTPLEGLLADPNATHLSGTAMIEPISSAGGPPATELMYAVQDVPSLGVTGEIYGDHTPVRAANFRVVPTKTGIMHSATDSEAAVEVEESPLSAAFAAFGRAVMRHRLAIVGLIGMVLAFVIGIVLARWAAQETRKAPVINVPALEVKKDPLPAPVEAPPVLPDRKYPHLDVLLAALREAPDNTALYVELRDAILEASNDLTDEKKKVALRRDTSSSARLHDLDGLAKSIDRLRADSE
jgi:serine/threonine protein kinase